MFHKIFLSQWPLMLAAIFCFLFGLTCLTLVQAAGDGTWYFYAHDFLSGEKLYSQLHLIQQPVFILVNALGISIFGSSYAGQKLIFVFVILGYIYLSYLIIHQIKNFHSIFKAILLLAFFFSAIHFQAYRFDDYHAFEDLLTMGIYFLTLKYFSSKKTSANIYLLFSLGLLTSLSILTRINDGLAIFLAVSFILVFSKTHQNTLKNFLVFIIGNLISFISVFMFLKETPSAWIKATLLEASSIKGGDSKIFYDPFILIKDCFTNLYHTGFYKELLVIAGFSLIAAALFYCLKLNFKLLKYTGVIFLIIIFNLLFNFTKNIDMIDYYTALSYLIGLGVFIKNIPYWTQKYILQRSQTIDDGNKSIILILPLALFAAGAMSSGGGHGGLYFPFALMLVTGFILFDYAKLNKITIFIISVLLFQLAFQGFHFRLENPYSWHSYRAQPIMHKHWLVQNPHLGMMYIDPELHQFITPICAAIPENKTLLSLPFPYANYFCGIQPWHNYVETFFDTSSPKTIQNLIQELKINPPDYIFYQQQLANLAMHERIYNNGKPLPQRGLDKFIMEKIHLKTWKTIYNVDFGSNSQWFLIETNTLHKDVPHD